MRLKKAIGPDDHVRGSAEAPVTLVEYGDYQSPACVEAYYLVQSLRAELGKQLLFVFRNFPSASLDPFAEYAALASEAAGAQGRFWQIHDFLFENPGAVRDGRLMAYARSIGIDSNRLDQDIAEDRHAERLWEEILGGTQSGVHGTPTFFINGVRHEGAWNFALLLAALKAALAAHAAPSDPETKDQSEGAGVKCRKRL